MIDGKDVFDRVMQYAGKSRKDVVSPRLTARESIALADYIQQQMKQIEALSDLARFMCSVWHRSEKFIYEHCDGDALMKYPVIQGTGNQINLMKIGTQPYSQNGVKAAVELLKGK